MPTTEIATMTLTPGADVGDPNNNASSVVNECCNLIAKQPGCQHLKFGPVIEDSSKMQMAIDWDSIQNRDDFGKSPDYGPFLEKFKTIMAGPPSFLHVDFEGELRAALDAPVTELATFYFQGDTPQNYTKGVHDFIQLCVKESPDQKVYGYATGTSHEEVEREGVKGKAGVLAVGWQSVEQHMEFRKTEVFQKNAPGMRQGAGSIEVHHTQFMNFVPS